MIGFWACFFLTLGNALQQQVSLLDIYFAVVTGQEKVSASICNTHDMGGKKKTLRQSQPPPKNPKISHFIQSLNVVLQKGSLSAI